MSEAIRELWAASPVRTECRQSCFCPVPEVCRVLTPEQVEGERTRRIEAGIYEIAIQRDGFVAVHYEASAWRPDEWVCSHYQRNQFVTDDDVWEHLGHCYVDYPEYWDYDG